MPKIILTIIILFAAVTLVCAVALAHRRGAGVGRRVAPGADPFIYPFGEMPEPSADAHLSNELHRRAHAATYTREQLEAIARRPVELHHDDQDSARPAIRADQGSGGDGKSSQGAAAARPYRGRERRAF